MATYRCRQCGATVEHSRWPRSWSEDVVERLRQLEARMTCGGPGCEQVALPDLDDED